MSLMGSLYIGVSGLRASQYSLNTTGHNLANVDTEGYVRQQVLLGSSPFVNLGQTAYNTLQSGLGVDTQAVLQVRDTFLDKAYRREVGRQGFYDSQYETVDEIENQMGELQGVAFQNNLEDLWEALQELAKEPDSLVTRASLIETGVSFIERAENIHNQLKEYQLNLNSKIKSNVDRINEIGDRIDELNNKISGYEAAKQEHANDLRDERNSLLDELGQLIKISYRENPQGKVTVVAEGVPFVLEDMVLHMSTKTIADLQFEKLELDEDGNLPEGISANENSQMLVPIWPSYGDVEVFDFNRLPSLEERTDIGSLKGLLLARGTKVANYLDIPVAPVKDNFYDEDGEFLSEEYDLALNEYNVAVEKYNREINPSIIMSTQAQFDQLIHGIVTTLNDILCPNKEVVIPAGTTVTMPNGTEYTYEEDTTIKILDEENAPIGMDGPPATLGEELFSRKSIPRYLDPQEITLEDGTTLTARIYYEEDKSDNYSLYTLGEIRVNQSVLEDQSKLPLTLQGGTKDYDLETANKLITAWQTPFATLDPNTLTMNNFDQYYNAFIGEIAAKGEKLDSICKNQQVMTDSLNNQRMEVAGVSSDEELTNMIKFHHAYNAAARYVNVVDDMLEHLLTRM